MEKTKLKEATIEELKWFAPDEDAFKLITFAYVDWHINGKDAKAEYQPDKIANDITTVYGDLNTPVKFMVVAAMLGWRDLITKLKPACEAVGWTSEDLKNTIRDLKTIAGSLEPLYEKYCIPALELVKAHLLGAQITITEAPNESSAGNLLNDLEEAIEKHDELNPALFKDSKLKPEVKDKINEIVDEFLKDFEEVEVELKVQDIILTGSNASYNYTKDSDLDIHILADTSKIMDTLKLHKVIYDAYKSNFNRKFEIELNKVPVEIYIETQDTPLVSNGIYSVIKDEWVKEPTKDDIPEVDQEAIDKAFKPWEKRYKALISRITDKSDDESEIDKFIDSLYDLRSEGLSTDGEYSIGNLIFKEMRNNGYLDNLKELRHKVIAQRLSLHESLDSLTTLTEYLNFLYKI